MPLRNPDLVNIALGLVRGRCNLPITQPCLGLYYNTCAALTAPVYTVTNPVKHALTSVAYANKNQSIINFIGNATRAVEDPLLSHSLFFFVQYCLFDHVQQNTCDYGSRFLRGEASNLRIFWRVQGTAWKLPGSGSLRA